MYCKVCMWFKVVWRMNKISVGNIWVYFVKNENIKDYILKRVIRKK